MIKRLIFLLNHKNDFDQILTLCPGLSSVAMAIGGCSGLLGGDRVGGTWPAGLIFWPGWPGCMVSGLCPKISATRSVSGCKGLSSNYMGK